VETIYASFPALLYLNASLTGRILDPLLEYQGSLVHAAPDLGEPFPTKLLCTIYLFVWRFFVSKCHWKQFGHFSFER